MLGRAQWSWFLSFIRFPTELHINYAIDRRIQIILRDLEIRQEVVLEFVVFELQVMISRELAPKTEYEKLQYCN